ncbi:MAG: hypothetical protein QG635_318 [Bacteroidota bacterium]|nr:hypothetical protein [Bacteroidota bacterium]
MKKLTGYILFLLVLIAANISYGAGAELKIIRTDVDSARSGFVTATYIFGFDVKIDSIKNCTALTFELQFNKTNYITFSEARTADFNGKGKYYVIPDIDYLNDIGKISVAASASDDIDEKGFDNPRVIHFEFAVSQTAMPNETVTFSFLNIYAVVYKDSIRDIVTLKNKSYNFDIHSFVNVWPGDADNNGTVNNLDFAVVAANFLTDSTAKASRRFKRINPSTLWFPQRVLAWDNHDATYSDCDGNGEITTTDMLVVTMNFDSAHSSTQKSQDNPLGMVIGQEITESGDYIKIPIYVKSPERFIGIASKIDLSPLASDFELSGIEKGDIFTGSDILYFSNINNAANTADLAFSTTDRTKAAQGGVLCYIAAKPKFANYSIPKILDIESTGLSSLGYFFTIEAMTNIVEYSPSEEYSIFYSSEGDYLSLEIANASENKIQLNIYDSRGEIASAYNLVSQHGKQNISTTELPTGLYFAVLIEEGVSKTCKFTILH